MWPVAWDERECAHLVAATSGKWVTGLTNPRSISLYGLRRCGYLPRGRLALVLNWNTTIRPIGHLKGKHLIYPIDTTRFRSEDPSAFLLHILPLLGIPKPRSWTGVDTWHLIHLPQLGKTLGDLRREMAQQMAAEGRLVRMLNSLPDVHHCLISKVVVVRVRSQEEGDRLLSRFPFLATKNICVQVMRQK